MITNVILLLIVILLVFLYVRLQKEFANSCKIVSQLATLQVILSTSTIKKSTSRKRKILPTKEDSSVQNSSSMPSPVLFQPEVIVQGETLVSPQQEKSYSPFDDAPTTTFNPLIPNDK